MAHKYTTIQQLPSGLKLMKVIVDKKNGSINVADRREKKDFEEFKKPKFGADRVVLALDSNNSSTIERILNIERENPKDKITQGELDRIVFKSLWEFLNEYRGWSFKKLGVADLDMILAGIDIFGIELDGKRVLDPVGFKGENLAVKLRGSFVPRDLLPLIDYFSDFGDEFRVVEEMSVVTAFSSADADFVLHCRQSESVAFSCNKEEIKFYDNFDFSLKKMIDTISGSLNISDPDSSRILKRYFEGEVSTRMEEYVDDKLKPHIKSLEAAVDALKDEGGGVKVNIPKPVYDYIFKNSEDVERIDYNELLERKGFNIINAKEEDSLLRNVNYLSLVAYPLFGKHYENLNKILERRSKWLVPEK